MILNSIINPIIVHDTWLVELTRGLSLLFSVVTAAGLFKLYDSHRVGRMNRFAGFGSVALLLCVGWAQAIALSTGAADFIPLNLGVMASTFSMMIGVFVTMKVRWPWDKDDD